MYMERERERYICIYIYIYIYIYVYISDCTRALDAPCSRKCVHANIHTRLSEAVWTYLYLKEAL